MTRVELYRHGAVRYEEDDGKLVFEINAGATLRLILVPSSTTPLLEPLADGEHWYIAIGKMRLDDEPIPVEHDRRLAVIEGRIYNPRDAESE